MYGKIGETETKIFMPKELTVQETRFGRQNGVPVYSGAGDQYDPVLIADGPGGAIFAWWDISTPDWNIFAQRLSAKGKPLWNPGDGCRRHSRSRLCRDR